MSDKKASLTIKIVVESILVLTVVLAAFVMMGQIKKVSYAFHYQVAENEKLSNQESAYLPFIQGSVKSMALREWKRVVVDAHSFEVMINCIDSSCSQLNASFRYKSKNGFEDLNCRGSGAKANSVRFDNPGLACCGSYLCVFANVNKDYKVSMTPYSLKDFDKPFVEGLGSGFVIRSGGNVYRVNLVNYATPFVRTGWGSTKYYNFMILNKTGGITYCSGKRIAGISRFMCNKKLPFKLRFWADLENGCKISILNEPSEIGKLTLTIKRREK